MRFANATDGQRLSATSGFQSGITKTVNKKGMAIRLKMVLFKTTAPRVRVPHLAGGPDARQERISATPHSILRVETQSIREVAMGSIARLSHHATSSP